VSLPSTASSSTVLPIATFHAGTYEVFLEPADNPQELPLARKWLAVLCISTASICVTCASSMVRLWHSYVKKRTIVLTRGHVSLHFRRRLLREASAGNSMLAKKSPSSVSVFSFWAWALGRSSRAQCQRSTGAVLSTTYRLAFSSCLCSLWRSRRT